METMLQHYPRLKVYQSRQQVDAYKLQLERSALRPQLSLSMRGGEERFANNRGAHLLGETGAASLQGKQRLFDGGYAKARVAEAHFNLQASRETLARTEQELALILANAYVDSLKFKRLRNLAEQNVELHYDALSKINTKFKAGAGPQADVLLVQGRLAKAQATLETRKRQLKGAHTRFLKLTGHLPQQLSEPDFPTWAMPQSLDEVDFGASPSIQAAHSNLQSAVSGKRIARSANRPQLNFIVEGDATDSGRYDQVREDAMAVISLSYNIFDGGRTRADVGRAEHRIQEAEWQLKETLIEEETRFANAWDELVANEERILLLDEHRAAMEKVVEAYHKQFELGKRPLINLLDVENELFAARSSLEEERQERLKSAYRLLASTGELLSALRD